MRMREWRGRLAVLCVCAVVLTFAARGAFDGASALQAGHLAEHVSAFAVAAACVAAAVVISGCVWALLVGASAPVAAADRPKLLVAFLYAWPSRYVPGAIPFFASKVYLCRKLGYGTRPAVISTSVQNLVDVIVGTGTAGILLAGAGALSTDSRAFLAVLLVSPAGLALLHPSLLRPMANRGLRLFGRDPLLERDLPSWQRLVAAAIFTFAAQCLVGLAALAVLSTMAGVRPSDAPLATGALALAGIAGMLAVFAPGGIGVREGVLASLLALSFPLETAALAAVLLRGVSVVVDITLLGGAVVYDALRRDPLAGRILGHGTERAAQPVAVSEERTS